MRIKNKSWQKQNNRFCCAATEVKQRRLGIYQILCMDTNTKKKYFCVSWFVCVCVHVFRKHRIKYGRKECRRCRPAGKTTTINSDVCWSVFFLQNFQKECKMWLLRIHCKKSNEHKHISD